MIRFSKIGFLIYSLLLITVAIYMFYSQIYYPRITIVFDIVLITLLIFPIIKSILFIE